MLQSFKKILNTSLHAIDGKIGHLDDLLFDDKKWVVRYLVVKTGGLLNRERVLISPLGLAEIDWPDQSVKLNLTQQQVEASPNVDTDLPVFRQMEKLYFDYYGWPYYWDDMSLWGINPRSSIMIGTEPLSESPTEILGKNINGDPHLSSCRIVSGYSIEAENTRFGHIEDFLIEDGSWAIRNLVVDAKKWWPHHPVMVTTKSVQSVDWFGRCVKLDMSKKQIEASPEFK